MSKKYRQSKLIHSAVTSYFLNPSTPPLVFAEGDRLRSLKSFQSCTEGDRLWRMKKRHVFPKHEKKNKVKK